MKTRIWIIAVLAIWFGRLGAQEKVVTPFVRMGLTSGFLASRGNAGMSIGFHLGAGAQIRLLSSGRFHLQPALEIYQKGGTLEADYGGKVTIRGLYLQLPVDALLQFHPGQTTYISLGVGPYVGYGIGGTTHATPGLYFYRHIPVDRHYSTFGPEVNMRRWDTGLHVLTQVEFHRYFVGAGFQIGFLAIDKREWSNTYELGSPCALNLYAGYRF